MIEKPIRVFFLTICENSDSVAVESKTLKNNEIIFINAKMMTESLYFYDRQIFKKGMTDIWSRITIFERF